MVSRRWNRRSVLRGIATASVGGVATLAGCSSMGAADVVVHNGDDVEHEVLVVVLDKATGEIRLNQPHKTPPGEDFRMAGALTRPDQIDRLRFNVQVDDGPHLHHEFLFGPGKNREFRITVDTADEVSFDAA